MHVPHVQGGDLRVAIHNDSARKLAWYGQGRNIALDVAHGIAFLHDRKVIHRDIKSKNILLTEVRFKPFGQLRRRTRQYEAFQRSAPWCVTATVTTLHGRVAQLPASTSLLC